MVAGQLQAGEAAAAQGESEQNMANYNAKLQERQAKSIEQQTMLQQRRQSEESARRMGTMRAGMGASGVVSTAGTALNLQGEQAAEDELENLLIGYEGSERATAARSQGQLDIMSGKIASQRGRSARTASRIGAGSSLLTGFGESGGGNKDAYLARKHGIA